MTQAQQDSPTPGILKMSQGGRTSPVALVYLCRAGVHKGEGHCPYRQTRSQALRLSVSFA